MFSERVTALSEIGNAETLTDRLKMVQTGNDVLEERQCLGPVTVSVRTRQERVVWDEERIRGIGKNILN